jgi:hypothetical protein
MEANIVILIMLVAYNHPSANSLGYFLAFTCLFYPMSKNITERYWWNLIILSILLVLQGGTLILKKKDEKIFKEQATYGEADLKTYQAKVRTLLFWGFSFTYDKNILKDEAHWGNIKKGTISDMNFYMSYNTEIIGFILNIFLMIFSFLRIRKI